MKHFSDTRGEIRFFLYCLLFCVDVVEELHRVAFRFVCSYIYVYLPVSILPTMNASAL